MSPENIFKAGRSSGRLTDGDCFGFPLRGFRDRMARQELRRSGVVIPIEPQVFDLLIHLIRNRDRIVSKDELIERFGTVVSFRRPRSVPVSARRGARSGTTERTKPSFARFTSADSASSAKSRWTGRIAVAGSDERQAHRMPRGRHGRTGAYRLAVRDRGTCRCQTSPRSPSCRSRT